MQQKRTNAPFVTCFCSPSSLLLSIPRALSAMSLDDITELHNLVTLSERRLLREKNDVKDLCFSISNQEEKLAELSSDRSGHQQTLSIFEEKYNMHLDELKTALLKLESCFSEESGFIEKVEDLEERASAFGQAVQDYTTAFQVTYDNFEDLNAEVSDSSEKLEASFQKRDAFRTAIQETKDELTSLNASITDIQEMRDSLKQDIEQRASSNETKEAALGASKQENQKLQEELAIEKEGLEALRVQESVLSEEIDALKVQEAESGASITQEVEELKGEVLRLQEEQAKLERESEASHMLLSELSSESENKRALLGERKEACVREESKKDQVQRDLQNALEKKEGLAADKRELENQLELLSRSLILSFFSFYHIVCVCLLLCVCSYQGNQPDFHGLCQRGSSVQVGSRDGRLEGGEGFARSTALGLGRQERECSRERAAARGDLGAASEAEGRDGGELGSEEAGGGESRGRTLSSARLAERVGGRGGGQGAAIGSV